MISPKLTLKRTDTTSPIVTLRSTVDRMLLADSTSVTISGNGTAMSTVFVSRTVYMRTVSSSAPRIFAGNRFGELKYVAFTTFKSGPGCTKSERCPSNVTQISGSPRANSGTNTSMPPSDDAVTTTPALAVTDAISKSKYTPYSGSITVTLYASAVDDPRCDSRIVHEMRSPASPTVGDAIFVRFSAGSTTFNTGTLACALAFPPYENTAAPPDTTVPSTLPATSATYDVNVKFSQSESPPARFDISPKLNTSSSTSPSAPPSRTSLALDTLDVSTRPVELVIDSLMAVITDDTAFR